MPAYQQGDRWRYRFVVNGRRYSGSAPVGANTKRNAEALERQHAARVATGERDVPTVRDFAPRFLEHQRTHTKPLTHELHTYVIDIHVVPHIGSRLLSEVTKSAIADLVMTWRKTAAATTCNTRLGVLLRMLGLAVEWDVLAACPKVKLLKVPKSDPRFLSDEEARLLLEAAESEPEWRPMILVALRTGLRIGELRGLQWGDVDLVGGAISVRRTDPGRGGMKATTPKGNRSRVVPLTPDALATLEQLRPPTWKPTDYVFPAPSSYRGEHNRMRPRSTRNCSYWIVAIATNAGLVDVGWHTLRHTFASHLVMRGVPMRAVQDLMGHSSIKQTEIYAHLAPGYVNRSMVAALDVPMVTAKMLGSGEQ